MEKEAKPPLRVTPADVQACELEKLYPGILRYFEKAGLVEIVERR